ncbi:MAG: M14 family metallopeptidase, partial [Planctomycetota bacterium]|nr:M14 family metallopeptidase [Planctomycetota bacterium]
MSGRFLMNKLMTAALLLSLVPGAVFAQDKKKPKNRSAKNTALKKAYPKLASKKATWLLPMPGIKADPRIPTLQSIVGHTWGQDVSSHHETAFYFKALARAAPNRCRLVQYGRSYENRSLQYLVISSPKNMKKLTTIMAQNKALTEPRKTSYGKAQKIIQTAPAIVWLAYSVHGDEISSTDAALLTAYHFLAARDKKTQALLENTVIIIDPLQNPDGRDRFVNVFREKRGVFLESNPAATEHIQRWPGGRSNHYHFDMNRDWFRQSQKETRHKVAAFLEWVPQIYVDAHEMGRNSSYFFIPPTDPINPYILPSQREWFLRIGKHQGKRFDQFGFDYTTREIFDAFYPGYGSEWPTMQGSIGILWEQASARGLVIDRNDKTKLHYHDGVRRHYLSALATVETASKNRKKLLSDFYDSRWRGVQLGLEGSVKHFFLLEGSRPERAAELARVLMRNGIEVRRVRKSITVICQVGTNKKQQVIEKGSYHIVVAQPTGRLIRSLLDNHIPMDKAFIERQKTRRKKSLEVEIYDVTAWSLPLAFDVPVHSCHEATVIDSQLWNGKSNPCKVTGAHPARVAYLIHGDRDGTPKALCHWLRKGIRVHVTDKAFRIDSRDFPPGSLIVKVRGNKPSLHKEIARSARRFHLNIHGVHSSFVESGAHFGGPSVKWITPPKILLLTDRPTSYSSGHTWYLFDQILNYPSTRVAGRSLGRVDLDRYNVLILPAGSYSDRDAPNKALVTKIKAWVKKGGTLILVKQAA